ncbi:MAG TPA: 3-phosphoserine/phosphohydroxythreonine transaminase [Candidatus Limiplasma sp.]|nr:3-phosphoserine/phosphohydroxythreonine transaminase [Candidatus Limiplasma sp.]
MERVYNFSAGPAVMDEGVLQKAASELVCYKDKGMSVMEMSHRTSMFMDIYNEAVALVREVLSVPDDYAVLFMQGGATLQFSGVPLNLMSDSKVADYIDTGNFAHLALKEAEKYGTVNVAATSLAENYTFIPEMDTLQLTTGADYVYITTNNTIYGTRYVDFPDTKGVPLVADMSSNIASQPMDVSKFGVIFAGAQKNIGPAGICLMLIRKDLLGKQSPICPKLMNWKLQAEKDSMLNTPNTWGIYMMKLVFAWMKEKGGIDAFYENNQKKAALLYDYIDNSKLFSNPVQKKYRSLMNVTFVTGDIDKDAAFVKMCTANGLQNIKGHRNVGGMRASIYNAMPMAGVEKLVQVMREFEKQNL